MSNYDISTALYGAKDDSLNVTSASEVEDVGEFSMVEHVQSNHKFKLSVFQPNDPKNFIKFVRLEVKLLRSSLPTGTSYYSQFLFSLPSEIISKTPNIGELENQLVVRGHSTTTWTEFAFFDLPHPCLDSFYTETNIF